MRSLTRSTTACKHAGIGVGRNTVTEVEDVPGVLAVVGQHRVGRGERHVGAGQHERRIEIALHHQIGTHAPPCIGDRGAPVEPEHGGPGGVHRLEEVVAADAEVDGGHAGMAGGQRGEDRRWSEAARSCRSRRG